VSAALRDDAYEGRKGALKALLRAPLTTYASQVDVKALRAQVRLLRVDNNSPCVAMDT
jgi:hypothetical protein